METNDVKKIADRAFNLYEQISDKILKDAIDKGLGKEEILGAATLLFLDTLWCSRLSLDGVTDFQSRHAQNRRVELSNKLNSFLKEFLSEKTNTQMRPYKKIAEKRAADKSITNRGRTKAFVRGFEDAMAYLKELQDKGLITITFNQ